MKGSGLIENTNAVQIVIDSIKNRNAQLHEKSHPASIKKQDAEVRQSSEELVRQLSAKKDLTDQEMRSLSHATNILLRLDRMQQNYRQRIAKLEAEVQVMREKTDPTEENIRKIREAQGRLDELRKQLP